MRAGVATTLHPHQLTDRQPEQLSTTDDFVHYQATMRRTRSARSASMQGRMRANAARPPHAASGVSYIRCHLS